MPSPIYQNIINMGVRFSIRRHPNEFMNVTMWEHRNFDNKIFRCGKVYYSSSVIITNFVQTLIPNCWFENVVPTYFGIEIALQNFYMVFRNKKNGDNEMQISELPKIEYQQNVCKGSWNTWKKLFIALCKLDFTINEFV
jgi:hypothetical protein